MAVMVGDILGLEWGLVWTVDVVARLLWVEMVWGLFRRNCCRTKADHTVSCRGET